MDAVILLVGWRWCFQELGAMLSSVGRALALTAEARLMYLEEGRLRPHLAWGLWKLPFTHRCRRA